MIVLGIETSTPQSSVCIGSEAGVMAQAAAMSPHGRAGGSGARAHAAFVSPAIRFCLEQAGVELTAVSGVAVSLGPGLFTGMRVGIATAQALAHARQLPVVGLSSLDLLAFPLRHARRLIVSALDARRGELFWAFYRSAPGGIQRVSELRVGPAEALAGEISACGEEVLCVGDGGLANRRLLESAGAEIGPAGMAAPSAGSVVELALPRFLREDTQRAEELRPVYVRDADAKIGWRSRDTLLGGAGDLAADPPVKHDPPDRR